MPTVEKTPPSPSRQRLRIGYRRAAGCVNARRAGDSTSDRSPDSSATAPQEAFAPRASFAERDADGAGKEQVGQAEGSVA